MFWHTVEVSFCRAILFTEIKYNLDRFYRIFLMTQGCRTLKYRVAAN